MELCQVKTGMTGRGAGKRCIARHLGWLAVRFLLLAAAEALVLRAVSHFRLTGEQVV